MLTKDRNTIERQPKTRQLGVKAGAIIYAGSLVVNDGGFAAPGREATGLVGLGRASATVNNTGGANGNKQVAIEVGCFSYGNSVADPVTAASIGKPVFVIDNETVAATDATNTRSIAGICFDVDEAGVWVVFA